MSQFPSGTNVIEKWPNWNAIMTQEICGFFPERIFVMLQTIATSRYEGKHKILPGSWFIHDEQTINLLPFFAPTESATS